VSEWDDFLDEIDDSIPIKNWPLKMQLRWYMNVIETQMESIVDCLSTGDYDDAMREAEFARDCLYEEIKVRMKIINLEYCEGLVWCSVCG